MANILASGYKDVFLPTTQCISTWRCLTLFSLQAVIVPVGRIALGRILNVVGSIIDPHSQFCHSHKSTQSTPMNEMNKHLVQE